MIPISKLEGEVGIDRGVGGLGKKLMEKRQCEGFTSLDGHKFIGQFRLGK